MIHFTWRVLKLITSIVIVQDCSLRMACSDSKPKRAALKKLSDIFQELVDSLQEISFNAAEDAAALDAYFVNRDHKREVTYRLKIVENFVKSIREQVPDIQESLTACMR